MLERESRQWPATDRYERGGGNRMKIRYNWKRITGRTACTLPAKVLHGEQASAV